MDSNNRNNRNGGNKKNNKNLRSVISLIGWALVLTLVFNYILAATSGGRSFEVPYSEMMDLVEQDQIKEIQLKDGVLYATPVDGYTYTEKTDNKYREPKTYTQSEKSKLTLYTTYLTDTRLLPLLDEHNVEYSSPVKSAWSVLGDILVMYILPMLLTMGLIVLVMRIVSKNGGGIGGIGNVGKSNAKVYMEKQTGVTFKDVAGQDEAKESLQEIIDFLHNPQKYTAIGAKLPKGALLVGSPGTGKTLLAKAVAGEADTAFLSISGSDFVEMYVGVGASRVRDLFHQAKQNSPAIVFIDEIDAVGRQRGSGLGGGHDEREQTLNQLLVEMDGFAANQGVVVLAATNRVDILDPALLRPGRFDRQIHVGRPDVKGREEILKVHAKDKKLDASVNLKTVARSTAGFTGADLSNLLNEAAILAARADRPVLTMEDMNEALMKITAGPAKKSRVQTRKDLKETAVHEAGHAVAMYNLPTHDPVRQITIVPRGQSLGATWYLPKDDSSNLTRNEMYEQIVSLLGGRVAEALFLGDISVGASNDIDRATKLAKDMVARYGMCEKLGTVSYLDGGEVFIGRDYQTTKSYSEKVAGTIDDEVRALIDKAYDHCKQILTDNSDKLHKVVDFLLEKETMTGEQFEAIMQGREVGDASSTSMFDGFEDGKEKPETTEE